MKLRLTYSSGQQRDDVIVTVDATATVGALAERLRTSHPTVRAALPAAVGALTLRVASPGVADRTADPQLPMADSGIRSGDTVSLVVDSAQPAGRPAAAMLTITSGPDAGSSFPLPVGTTFVGRDRNCDVRLADPQVSKRHLRINVSDLVEIIDENSANGTAVNGQYAGRFVVRSTDVVQIGDTVCTLTLQQAQAATPAAGTSSHSIAFNRSPRLDPRYEGVELVAPEPPQRPQSQRFPVATLIAPILMGGVLYVATRNVMSILFVVLSPLMLLGSFLENRIAGKRQWKQGQAEFRAALRDLAVQLRYATDREQQQRRREHPSVGEVAVGVSSLTPLTWTRRPRHDSFLEVRLGLGTLPSRNSVAMPSSNSTTPEMWREMHQVVDEFSTVERVPVVADLRECGGVGVAGPPLASFPLACSVMVQIAGLHSPAEVVLAAIASSATSSRWEWLKWLPHVGSEHSPLTCEHLAGTDVAARALISELEELVERRAADHTPNDPAPMPCIVVLVEDGAAVDRARLVSLIDSGQQVGVHVVWVAPSLERIPAACRAYLDVDPNTGEGRAGFVDGGIGVQPLELEPIDADACVALARRLAPITDAGAVLEDQSDLPRSVSLLTIGGLQMADDPTDLVERWKGSNSLPPEPGAPRLKRDNTLRALIGQGSTERFYLDLRTQGPHALVGGTTGAGKSEFLQSWIIGMAAAHSPARVNFLFVDYKGGAAFADCIDLPHTVGLVTDLSPHLVRRALRSLNAELRRREHVLNQKKAKDVLELERKRDPDAPPSLVIVVDEFAALVSEVPEFVDGVVNVAQRGRSLGLHLILATQRPAGVIKDNLRANTNLRVALRMADEADSEDVIGTTLAATFDPGIPGRGVAKTGPGRLTSFQAGYVGGYTSDKPPTPAIDVYEYRFGAGASWDVIEQAEVAELPLGANDIRRVVETIKVASQQASLPPARQPWLPELAPAYRLEELPSRRTDRELVFGVVDVPDDQSQPVVAFAPDTDGNMAIFGTGGSGKSTFLRTIAVAAGFSPARGGPCQVYGLDFGARGLRMLEDLPHVGAVIAGEDVERTTRLLQMLRTTIDGRAERYAKANAGTIVEYRQRSTEPDEPRILVLLDNFGAFRQAYEVGQLSRWYDMLQSIATDGRAVGVHVVISADRPGAVPTSLMSAVQKRLVLRLSNEMDYTLLSAPEDVLTAASPPGRGMIDGAEVQVAVLGGESNVARQAAEITKFAAAMRRAGMPQAPSVRRLPERVLPTELPDTCDGLPTLGVWDETLAPIGFEPAGVFVVAGPPQSGKTNAVAALLTALRRHDPSTSAVLLGTKRSPLQSRYAWRDAALTADEIDVLAADLAERIADDDPSTAGLVVVIESVGELLNGPADTSVQDLVKACRANDRFVIAEGETSTLGSSWPLLQAVRASRYGIALQPEQMDGDLLFKVNFPRATRADFPQGRGLYVRSGRIARVQLPLVG
jgi:DNA segregation ATPase FtsK/SpoIIIE, S-DNA-T family